MRTRPKDFIDAVQTRCARVAVSASATRGQKTEGLVAKAREHLAHVPLGTFGTSNAAAFRSRLDRATDDLVDAVPGGRLRWGVARKLLNIFLRDALYTAYLRDRFHLDRAEALFELPLDSITARRLRKGYRRGELPCWRGVRHLRPADSDEFQRAATDAATQCSVARVHLDAFWWSYRNGDRIA